MKIVSYNILNPVFAERDGYPLVDGVPSPENIYYFLPDYGTNSLSRISFIIDNIRRQFPDVILLQEVDDITYLNLKFVFNDFDSFYAKITFNVEEIEETEETNGVCIFWKKQYKSSVPIIITAEKGDIHNSVIIDLHERDDLHENIRWTRIACVHLKDDDPNTRGAMDQLKQLVEIVETPPEDYSINDTIIGGDFNADYSQRDKGKPSDERLVYMSGEGYRNAVDTTKDQLFPTYLVNKKIIDYIFHKSGIISGGTIKYVYNTTNDYCQTSGSDHLLISALIKPKVGGGAPKKAKKPVKKPVKKPAKKPAKKK